MPTCSFCKKMFKEPRGLTVFTFDGRSIHFCSSKCRRNANLKRDPRKTNWVRKSGVLISGTAEDDGKFINDVNEGKSLEKAAVEKEEEKK